MRKSLQKLSNGVKYSQPHACIYFYFIVHSLKYEYAVKNMDEMQIDRVQNRIWL